MGTKRFTYPSDPSISALVADQLTNFLWMAFEQDSSGNCRIEKQTAFQPTQTFFTLTRAVDQIRNMTLDASNLYAVYDDTTAFAEKFSLTNPLTSFTQITAPAGITESGIDIQVNGSDIWVLTPGTGSGENAKMIRFNTSLVFQETVDLNKSGSIVTNARTFSVDGTGDMWVITYNSPAEYVRVFALSGGGYDFTIHQTIP